MPAAWRSVMTYNRYASICARTVRRVLKEEKRIEAERRGEMLLKMAKWEGGRQGEVKTLIEEVKA
ncbi:hypothetical protein YB2330_002083 [Saitoella coloradoensis]